MNGTMGRIYGGDPNYVHIPDGTRREVGLEVALAADREMRLAAALAAKKADGPLCPGCYMIALFNAAVELAKANGHDLKELGRTMANAYTLLAEKGEGAEGTEEINIILDPD